MTGVGGRPEVVIEGALRESGPWKEYHFTYKPGKLCCVCYVKLLMQVVQLISHMFILKCL